VGRCGLGLMKSSQSPWRTNQTSLATIISKITKIEIYISSLYLLQIYTLRVNLCNYFWATCTLGKWQINFENIASATSKYGFL
jgi:hypothetical protein